MSLPLLAIPLLLLTVAPTVRAQDDSLREAVNHALDSARPALMAHLEAAVRPNMRPGALALVILAAIHDGVDRSDPRLKRAVDRLASLRLDQTYDLALRLMVMELMPSFPDREDLAQTDVKALLQNRDDGAFGYQPNAGQWDLSNTQYAALGLRAGKAVGVKISRRVWSGIARQIGSQQDPQGGFGYQKRSHGFASYASMTAAGIAVLAVCRQALDDDNDRDSGLDRRIELGWQWFERNVASLGSRTERWSYYFHYGLERAAILCDVERIGEVSWYERGARMLVEDQLDGGGWNSPADADLDASLPRQRGSPVSTSFAILFLRRKFQKVAGPITPRVVTLPMIGPNSKPGDVDECAAELVRRGKEGLPDVLRALRSDIENQRRAAAVALRTISGEDFGYDPAKSPDANAEIVKKAELWYLRNR